MAKPDNRTVAKKYVEALPTNFEVLTSLQHKDFIQEFPQSGEVIHGSANFRAAHENYPGGSPEDRVQSLIGTEDRWALSPSFSLVRLIGSGDTFTAESKARYPDGNKYDAITILELKDGKIYRARTYFAPPFEPPPWRSQWVELRDSSEFRSQY